MQFKGKLTKQTLKTGKKKSNLGPDFGLFLPKFGPKIFFCEFYLYQVLEVVTSYHCMLFQRKLINQT